MFRYNTYIYFKRESNMNKIITTIALVLGLMFFAFVPVQQVSASSDECTEVPGPYGSQYGNRVCDTDLISSGFDTSAMVLMAGLFVSGGILYSNGKFLKSRIN